MRKYFNNTEAVLLNNWITSILTLMIDKRVFSKETESTATFLGLAWMVLRTVITTKTVVR